MQGKAIIIFASGYDAPPTSKHHVAHILAQDNKVIWVNYHASRAPSASASDILYIFKKLIQVFRGTREVRKNLFVVTPFVIPLPGSKLAKWFNKKLLIHKLRKLARKHCGDGLQVWSFAPDVAYLIDGLVPEKVLYYCVDDFAHFTGYDTQQVVADEKALMARANLTVTTSQVLYDARCKGDNKTILVPHGVDYQHFAKACDEQLAIPSDLADIPEPRIGFFGLIRDWVDLKTLAVVAKRKPSWQFVLLGDSTIPLDDYRNIENMHFLGRKSYEELPAYCSGFDVGLIPFVNNELTKAVNPIKLREYLSAALPVVSSPMDEVEKYARQGLARIAKTPEDYINSIQCSLNDTKERRIGYSRAMREETWPAKVEMICDCLMEADE